VGQTEQLPHNPQTVNSLTAAETGR